jgi:site-specific DNA recombinase
MQMDLYSIRNELMSGKSIYDLNLKVTFYSRVSTNSEEQLTSLKHQREYFKEYIENQPNWEYFEGYIDEAISGVQATKRDAFNKMIEDGRNKKFSLVLTKEISRFSRNTMDSLFYTRELLKHGIGVFFTSDNINTLYPDSELRLTIMSSIAQEESRKISERVKWGKKRAMENGHVMCNERFWGYNRDGHKLVINQEESKMVRLIFDLYLQNKGLRSIADIISIDYKNHNGNPFNFTSIRNILVNPRYMGYYTAKKTITLDYMTKEREYLKPDQWIMYKAPDLIPPIVSEEIWHAANNKLKKKAEKMASDDKTSYQNKFLYSGKIYCSQHNTTYWRSLYKYDTIEDKEIWQCKVYRKEGKKGCDTPLIYKHELDLIVKNCIKEMFSNKEYHLSKLMDLYKKYINDVDHDKDIKDLMVKIEIVKKKKEKLLDLSVNGFIENNEFKKRNDEYNNQIKLHEEQIKKYEQINDIKYDVQEQLKTINILLSKNIEFANTDEITDDIVNSFLEKIVISKGIKENEVKLNVILKPAISIKAIYRRDVFENMHLLLTTHMVGNKQQFKFSRNTNNRGQERYDINVEVETELRLGA